MTEVYLFKYLFYTRYLTTSIIATIAKTIATITPMPRHIRTLRLVGNNLKGTFIFRLN